VSDTKAPLPRTRTGAIAAFQLFGFPVRIRLEFLIVAALLGSAGGTDQPARIVSWVGIVFVSVLFHELGHALLARRCGYRPWIELYGMGGVTHMVPGEAMRPSPWTSELAIALAGPTFGFLFGAAVWLFARFVPTVALHPAAREAVRDLLWANIGWSVLNLVPMLPYDGGLAASAVLGRIFPRRGALFTYGLTVIVGTAALAGSIYIRNIWTGYLAARGLFGALRPLRFHRALVRTLRHWEALDFPRARIEAQRAAMSAYDLGGRAQALELLVYTCLATKDAAAAKTAYDAFPPGLRPSPLLSAIVALDGENYEAATEHFQKVPQPLMARVLIPILVCWGTSGWQDRAMAWMSAPTFATLPPFVNGVIAEALFVRGCYELSERLHELRFKATHSPVDAYCVARALAKRGQSEAALSWLERALDAGFTDIATWDQDEVLRGVRVLDGYQGLRRRIAGLSS
jgi:hypothetical protein